MSEIQIDPRFCGPPASGNGGYVAGRLAAHLGPAARVRLRRPPPLDTPLRVQRHDDGASLLDGDVPVAEAWAADATPAVPPAPGFQEASRAAHAFRGFVEHPYPGCFVCGTSRDLDDGLRIFAGPVSGTPLVAAPWIPSESLAGPDGFVRREFLWAALDCPGAFTFDVPPGATILLGEITARFHGDVCPGERCVVSAWHLGRSGRKHEVGTALHGPSGDCRGVARAVWLEIPAAPDGVNDQPGDSGAALRTRPKDPGARRPCRR